MPVLKLSLILVVKAVNSLRRIDSPLSNLVPFREVNLNSLGGEHLYISIQMVHDCEAKRCRKSLAEYLPNIFIFYFTILVSSCYLSRSKATFEPFESFC
jgi:hypothetical protein